MPSPSKALLVQVQAFLANNNVRKNIGSFGINVQKTAADIRQVSTILLFNNGMYTFVPAAGNLLTILSVSSPLLADVTFAGGGGFSKTISQLLVLDVEVSQIVLTNQSLTDNSELTIING